MFLIIAGSGKVGSNVARILRGSHELVLIEQDRQRHADLEDEFGHSVQLGDATEI